ncbi:PAS domain-containing sensor histidine kinase [Spirosoma radiotolerans]|uniref:PAS domain-containing sensor histidine kinase n=1 Tax=Spirosoma radiotolerans TaxID=1379870 RepID=UPI000A77BD14|nr:PAS domain S-box protein [Spirosoma radiotolerans]
MNGDQKPLESIQNLSEQLDVQFALQATGLGIWEFDPSTKQVLWDDRCRQLFGLATDNKLPYEQAIQYVHPLDVDLVSQAVQQVLTGQSNGTYDQTYRTIGADDGQLRWVRFYGKAYFTPAGELYRFAGVAQEVTQQVMSQQQEVATRQQAQRQQRIYEAIASSTPDLMYVFDLSYRFTYANQALLTMWGKSWEDAIGKSLLENGYEPWHAQMHEREIDQVVATKQPIRGEVSFPHATLGTRIYDYVFAPVFNDKGEVEAIAGTTRDITEMKQAEETVRESETNNRLLFEAMQEGYTVCEAIRDGSQTLINYRFQQVNPAFSQLTGLDAAQTLGRTAWEVLPGLDPKWYAFYQQVLDTRQPMRAEEYIPLLNEWYELTAFWFAGDQFAVLFDRITERKRQELNLAFLAQVSQELVGLTDIDETITSLGAKIGQHFGLSRCLFVEIDEAQQVCWVSYGWGREGAVAIPGKHRIADFISPQFQQASRAGETVVIDDVFADPRTDGEQYAAFQIGAMVTVPLLREGEWYFLLGFYDTQPRHWREDELALMRELTMRIWTRVERARAEAALKESEQRFRLLADALPQAIWVTDPAGNTEFMNKWWADYSGIDYEPNTAWQVAATSVHPEDAPQLTATFQQAIQSEKGFALEQRNRSASGEYRWFLNVGVPYRDPKTGQITKWVGMGIDIDERKRAQQALADSENRYRSLAADLEQRVAERTQALQQVNQDLTRSNANLQQFAYAASHDLQEPLRKIQSFSALLADQLDDQLTESSRSYLQRITAAGSRMSMLIKDLLAYSRIATRQQTFGPVSLNAIVKGVLSTLDWEIQQAQAQIQVDDLPVVNGDESQLGQLFQNLLTNAIKFVGPKQLPLIHIQYVQCSPSDLPGDVRPGIKAPFYHQINVVDQGVGFDEKFRDRIFQVFQRLHGKNEYPGSGVGLAICLRVVENHGGGITAISEPGHGATFCVYLPAYV